MKEVNPVKTLDSIDKDKSSDKIIKKLTPKEKSYLLLTKALPPLEKIAKGWPGRQDLQETIQLLKKTLEKNHLNGHTKAFVSILSTLEGIIPLTKQSKDYPLLVKLQRKVLSHNKETNNQETTEKGKKEIPPEPTLHALKKIKAYLKAKRRKCVGNVLSPCYLRIPSRTANVLSISVGFLIFLSFVVLPKTIS